jgi:hypothetical protein
VRLKLSHEVGADQKRGVDLAKPRQMGLGKPSIFVEQELQGKKI